MNKNMAEKLTCFKAYDIRGKLGEELNEDIAWRIGRAYAEFLKPKQVVIGGDVRLTSESLKMALARGLMDAGCDVLDIGLSGTEEIYFSTFHLGCDGGIEVTASHNPIDYNGMKLVRHGAQPISGDTGLNEIKRLAEENQFTKIVAEKQGHYKKIDIQHAYVDHLLSYIDTNNFRNKKLKIVINSGNGSAGHVIDEIERRFKQLNLMIEFIKVHHNPDGTFPHGIPNPLLPSSRKDTQNAIRQTGADIGIAFDGDFDRCFFFDEHGNFIEGYYIVGLLAEAFLRKDKGAKIIHDPRLTWNTIDIVEKSGGVPIMSKTGHAFIKERMRKENAIYGGEMSAHHYFRDFAYCDSGMIPWLLVAELVLTSDCSLCELVESRIKKFPVSGEINCSVSDSVSLIKEIEDHYASSAYDINYIDGLSMSFGQWRFNVRTSNTEPLLRLNVEAKNNHTLMQQKTNELLGIINK
ncbi:UNVERIFIED_ORG: phosphomannomutase [Kosakonia oryzae]|uniref:Phosphomannomutase n=2 Tax=Kosakonia radicincitans TaxID=283686 RepID=A0AAX2EVA6_9ENTR|nr:phosphomannomutase [Kosakonia oryzae]SFF08595.1 phosphomannomutase [Kosakonia radicincitans]SFR20626.1 phosphomannomutase [Kosakonia radicincitans]SFT90324.1 phosphomannomutase [Kosakonia radicincitans]SFX79919.1 phosphomannomutase [Kosakonia radicincitans]